MTVARSPGAEFQITQRRSFVGHSPFWGLFGCALGAVAYLLRGLLKLVVG